MRHDVFGASVEEWHRSPKWHYEEARSVRMRSKENSKQYTAPNISQGDGGTRRGSKEASGHGWTFQKIYTNVASSKAN